MEQTVERQQLAVEQLLEEVIQEIVGIRVEEVLEAVGILEEHCLEGEGIPGRCECVCEYEHAVGGAGTWTYLLQPHVQVRGWI